MNDLDALIEDLLCRCLAARDGRNPAELERLLAAQPAEVRAQVTAMLGTLDRVGLTGAAVPAPDDARAIPFGPYLLLERLGAGAMGVVYRARDHGGVERALKLLQPGLLPVRRARLRFEREVQALRELDHPGICPILDAGEAEGVPFLVMPLVPGETLQALFVRGPALDDASRRRLLAVVEQVASALHHAHERGFVHRDVKPANILLATDDRPVVLDFGLARLDRDDAATLSQSREVIGAPAYMAPEQIADGARVDRRADVYALGVVLYEGLTGRCPFEAATRESLYRRILTGDVASPSRRIADLPATLDAVCLTALAREPDRRYQTAAALAADLARVRTGKRPLAQLPGVVERTGRWISKHPLPSSLMALLALAVVAALWQTFAERRSSARDRARVLVAEAFDVLPADPSRAEQLARQAHALAPDVLDSLTALEAARTAEREDVVLAGHARPVTDLDFSADGERVVSASLDGTARIWDLRTAACIELAHDGEGPAFARFQPGGDLVATAGRSDGRVRAWDAASGRLRWHGTGRPAATARRVLLWSPHGDWLLAGGPGGAWLWSAAGESHEIVRAEGAVTAGAWIGPDEFAIGSEVDSTSGADTRPWVRTFRVEHDGTTQLQDDHQLASGVTGLHAKSRSLTASSPATLLIVSAQDVYRWTVGTAPERLPPVQARGVHTAAWAADGERALTLGGGGVLAIWPPERSRQSRNVQTVSWATGLVSHPRQNFAFVSSGAGVIQVRSLDGAGARLLGRRQLRSLPLAVSADGRRLAATDWNHAIHIWSMWHPEAPMFFAGDAVRAAVWSDDGNRIITGSHRSWSNTQSGTGIVRTWDARTGELMSPHPQLELDGPVTELLPDRKRSRLVALHGVWNRGFLCLVGDTSGTLATTNRITSPPFERMPIDGELLRTGSVVAVGEQEGVFVWDPTTAIVEARLPVMAPDSSPTGNGYTLAVAATPDGATLWCGGSSGHLHRFDRRADGAYVEGPTRHIGGHIYAIEYLADGSLLLGLANGVLQRLMPDGTSIAFVGHRHDVCEVEWTDRDGELLVASGDFAGSVRLWRDDGTLLREIRAHTAAVWSVRFSPQGDRLLTGSTDGTARIWPVRLEVGR